jgi:hypothetical protein
LLGNRSLQACSQRHQALVTTSALSLIQLVWSFARFSFLALLKLHMSAMQ